MNEIVEIIRSFPIIAALRHYEYLDEALHSQANVIFLLGGDIFSIGDVVNKIKAQDKIAFVHADLIDGLGRDRVAMEYIAKTIKPDGIISTRSSSIKYAKEVGLFSIQRFFLVDSQGLTTGVHEVRESMPDAIEVLPGIIHDKTGIIASQVRQPVIAGGLVEKKDDVIMALKAGAIAISTSKRELWFLE
ncbi:glycerol-3-phosphate responsive antiterminator [Calorimonas adulescens]|uniref:Glycerol-3-phosphate responsive antiterminator n=1 Tax=Calorimonas adulescens TaxID=2606906 RepID=A0A5D8QE75_9THEO|nr:glycerol-3-phosphate responsive antiterminator [Calorimonas adulescens]TZE83010.1 glycerol-3-phosphate responsive antiterminator [Calorimonas adulescens]